MPELAPGRPLHATPSVSWPGPLPVKAHEAPSLAPWMPSTQGIVAIGALHATIPLPPALPTPPLRSASSPTPPSSLATPSCSACASHTSSHSTSPTPVADYAVCPFTRGMDCADCPTVIHPTVEKRGGDGVSHRAGGREGSAAAVTSRRECKTHLGMTGFFVAYLPTPVQHGPSQHDNQINISNPGVGEASRPVKFAFRSSIAITRPPRPPRRHPRRLPCLLPPSPRSWAPGRLRCSCRSSRRASVHACQESAQ